MSGAGGGAGTDGGGVSLGAIRIDPVDEVKFRLMPKGFLFPTLTQEMAAQNADWLAPGMLHPDTLAVALSFRSYLIRAGGQTILVDTCNGNHKNRPHAPWQHDMRSHAFMRALGALDVTPDQIDIVLCSHLHTDHVGWNTRLDHGRWVPTFPNARYVISAAEYQHFKGLMDQATGEDAVRFSHLADSVLPVVEAGLAEFVSDTAQVITEIGEEVFLSPSPGHTPGHCCIHARAKGAEAVIAGDAVHHAIQFDLPDMPMRADADAGQAAISRRRLMEHCAGTGALLCAGHIPFWPVAQVREGGNAFRLTPV